MGASASNLRRLVKEEFTRLRKDRDYLVLDNVLEFQLSLSGWRLDPTHVGVLLAIDRDRDGKFQLKELWDFALTVHKIASSVQSYELQSAVHGTFMLELWRLISDDKGLADIVDWCGFARARRFTIIAFFGLCALVVQPVFGDATARQTAALCLAQGARAHDMDTFINTLQRVAEERGLLELSNPALDDWVPQPVLSDYVEEVLKNMRRLVSDMDVLQSLLQEESVR